MELGLGSEETSSPEQDPPTECDRPTPPDQPVEENGLSVGLRSEQMCVSGVITQPGPGIQQLLEKPQRPKKGKTSRIPPIQKQEERIGIIPVDRIDQSIRELYPIAASGHSETQRTRLSATDCEDIECDSEREGGSLVRLDTGGDRSARI